MKRQGGGKPGGLVTVGMRACRAQAGSDHPSDADIRFILFGRFHLMFRGEDLPGFDPRRVQELLAYVVLSSRRTHHREVLAEILWPECRSDSKKNLRQALWQAKLGERNLPSDRKLLNVEAQWVQLRQQEPVSADVWDVRHAYELVRGSRGDTLTSRDADILRHAIDVYSADLLEGWYPDWCVYEREHVKTIYLALLDKLLDFCQAGGLEEEGLFYAERILTHDRAHERTYNRMMLLYRELGDRVRALRQYRRCEVALSEELGVRPSERTRQLFQRIRDEQPVDF